MTRGGLDLSYLHGLVHFQQVEALPIPLGSFEDMICPRYHRVHPVAEISRFYPFRLAPQPTPSKNLAIRPVDDSPEYGSQLA